MGIVRRLLRRAATPKGSMARRLAWRRGRRTGTPTTAPAWSPCTPDCPLCHAIRDPQGQHRDRYGWPHTDAPPWPPNGGMDVD